MGVKSCNESSLLGAILIISGTAVGAAMLALPVSTGMAGFIPSCLAMVVCWIYMTYTALLIVELQTMYGLGMQLSIIAQKTMGNCGKTVHEMVYLFLLYALNTAYIAGIAQTLFDSISYTLGWSLPLPFCSLVISVILGALLYQGIRVVDKWNRWFMCGLLIAYIYLIYLCIPMGTLSFLEKVSWNALFPSLSVVVTSFGFHIVIPSLSTYLGSDVSRLKKAILFGSVLPVVAYLAWQAASLGAIPQQGEWGIEEGYKNGWNGAELLAHATSSTQIGVLARIFSFCAIFTSFLGVSLSLFDFLKNRIRLKASSQNRVFFVVITFLPPLIITWIDPRAFLSALEWAGAFGVVILLGLMPVLMVWRSRYYFHRKSIYQAPGGRWALCIAFVLSIAFIVTEALCKWGYLI